MGPMADDHYRTSMIPAFMSLNRLYTSDNREGYVDELLKSKDEISKEDILSRLDQFSCKEELERYVEGAENYRFHVM